MLQSEIGRRAPVPELVHHHLERVGTYDPLPGKDGIKEVRLSSRLVDSPAIVVDHESAAMRKMMKLPSVKELFLETALRAGTAASDPASHVR